MNMKWSKFLILAASIDILILITSTAEANPGSVESGRAVYLENCYQCHGYSGSGDGPKLIHLPLKPRNFTPGVFKLKTSPPSFNIVRNEDLYNVVQYGMPGGGMPAFEGLLSDQEQWDVVAYIKSLSNIFKGKDNPPSLDFSGKVPSSQESIARGQKVYGKFKCGNCHGETGEALSSEIVHLTDDQGNRVWPRDLTRPRTFSGPYTPEALYARVTNGIPGTPMPSFADRVKEGLTQQNRWDVVNYVMWLAEDAAKKRRYKKMGLGGAAAVVTLASYFFLWPYMRKRIRS